MKLEPISSNTFGLNKQTKIMYTKPYTKIITDTVKLANGKRILYSKTYEGNTLTSKLSYLKNAAGEWVKSRLRYYKGGKVVKTLDSQKEV